MFLSGTVPPYSFPSSARFPHISLSYRRPSLFSTYNTRCLHADGFSVRTVHYRLVRISFASSIFFSLPDTCCSFSFSLFPPPFGFSSTYNSLFDCRSAPLSLSLLCLSRHHEIYATSSYVLTRVSRKNSPRDPPISHADVLPDHAVGSTITIPL